MMREQQKNISIPEFYADKNLLLTGGTGFIGKVLIEKLLRSCPGVRGVYCLIRPKRGQTGQERLKKMMEQKLFTTLREEQPDYHRKVHAVSGDLREPGLGLSKEDCSMLQETIHIVIHSAATIRFDAPLRDALEMNVLAVRKMIELAKGIKGLQAFVHVSTAYSNCDRSYIDEVVYPPRVEPQKLLDAAEWLEDDLLDSVTNRLIGDFPNTYTYTKQLAETLIMQEAQGLPLAILRPSIVTAAYKEPLSGWVDNVNGPSGLYIAVGKGIMRTMFADTEVVADIIPVDLSVNLLLSVVWYTAVTKPNDILVYHSTTGCLNPFTWGEMRDLLLTQLHEVPYEGCYRRPYVAVTKNSFLHDYWVLVSHMIPAYLTDLGCLLVGKKPRMVQTYQKLHKAMGTLEYFTVRSWEWTHGNMDMLKSTMTESDIKMFQFDPRMMNWHSYIKNYVLGTKKYILKEELSGLPAAQAHIKKLRNIRWAFNAVILIMIWRLIIARLQIARNSWSLVMGMIFKFLQFFRLTSTLSK